MDNQKSMDLGAVKEQIRNTRRSWKSEVEYAKTWLPTTI
jgi:hypothetical protein